jgi:hypothetical protein
MEEQEVPRSVQLALFLEDLFSWQKWSLNPQNRAISHVIPSAFHVVVFVRLRQVLYEEIFNTSILTVVTLFIIKRSINRGRWKRRDFMARRILRTKLCDMLGIEYPIICAGMGPTLIGET